MKKSVILLLLIVSGSINAFAQHTLVFKNGDKMQGKLISVKDGDVAFSMRGNTMTFKLAELNLIQLDDAAALPGSVSATATPAGKGAAGAAAADGEEVKTIMAENVAVKYVMKGRTMIKAPKIINGTQETGTVVVTVTIDKYGNVMKAEPGAAGTTGVSDYLLTKAKQAVESAKFNNVPTAPLQTIGTITIPFL